MIYLFETQKNLANLNYANELKNITCPVLVIQVEKEVFREIYTQILCNNLPDCKYRYFDNVGTQNSHTL